jgi:hypothetical protein
MMTRKTAWALALLASAPFALAQRSGEVPPAGKAVVTGVWRGELNNLPIITLVVSDEGNGLAGGALFYMLRRETVNDPFTASPGLPEPMLNLTFDGNVLRFLISHRRAHPPRTLADPPSRFHLTLTGPDKAEFVNDSENHSPAVTMLRSDY